MRLFVQAAVPVEAVKTAIRLQRDETRGTRPELRAVRNSIALVFLSLALCVLPAFADVSNDMSRASQSQTDLENLEAMARDATNEVDRAMWNKRVELAKKEIQNTKRLTALESREEELARARKNTQDTGAVLHDLLRGIETDAAKSTNAISDLDRKIRKTKDARAAKAAELSTVDSGDDAAQRRADIDQTLRTLDVETGALTQQRDALDLQLRLDAESRRLEEMLRDDALLASPSIRGILAKRRAAEDAAKMAEAYGLHAGRLQAQRDGTQETLAIEQERFNHLDEEISTLTDLYRSQKNSLFSFKKTDTAQSDRQQRTLNMLSDARSQKVALGARIEFRKAHVAALDDCIATTAQMKGLREAENRHMLAGAADMTQRFLRKIYFPCVVVFSLLLINLIFGRLILPIFFRRESLLISRRACSYFMLMLATLVMAISFLDDLKAIATLLGLVGAAIVIALQDLCSAFAGWFVIVAGRKVRVGDRVEIDGMKGDVVDIEILRTTLLEINNWLGVDEETGRVTTVPNSFIFKSQVFNYTRMHPYIWGKMDITMTYETPFREAQDLLRRILEEETREEFEAARDAVAKAESRYGLPESNYDPKLYTVIADSGVLFTLVYAAHYKKIAGTRTKIGRRILAEFEKDPRMQLAYPTQRQLQTEVPNPVPVR